jgi:hypothetical protein
MDDGNGIPAHAYMITEPEPQVGVSLPITLRGLNPITALCFAFWYSLIAAAAMSSGFAFLYKGSKHNYYLTQNLMWVLGIGLGIAIAVCLARRSRFLVGATASVLMAGLLLSLLYLIGWQADSGVSIFGFQPSEAQLVTATAGLTLVSGLLGTMIGNAVRRNETLAGPLLGIRKRHWFWLWLAVYAWVAILPTGIYYIWLEFISTRYVLIHPSLWLGGTWTVGWALTIGFAGIAAMIYGIQISIINVSAAYSSQVRTRKRVLYFLLGTLILAGPVANILFRIAIHSLTHLPDGITANPWWIMR